MPDDLFGGMPLRWRIAANIGCKAAAKTVDKGYASGDREMFLAALQHAADWSRRRAVTALCVADLERYERHLVALGPAGRTRGQDDDLRMIGKARECAISGRWPDLGGAA